nr:MAG: hypothetical protein KatS3mg041_1023 [Bacteroidota bacterium]
MQGRSALLVGLGLVLLVAGIWNLMQRHELTRPDPAAANPSQKQQSVSLPPDTVPVRSEEGGPEEVVLREDAFVLRSGQEVKLDTEGGEIVLESGQTDTLWLRVGLRRGDPQRARAWWAQQVLEVEETTQGLSIRHRSRGAERLPWAFWHSGSSGLVFRLRVPRTVSVELVSSGGDIHVLGPCGPVTARTSGGDIRLEGLVDRIEARSSGGDMVLRDFSSPHVELSTSGGDISLSRGRARVLHLRSSGGDLWVEALQVEGDLALISSGGDIKAQLQGLGAEGNRIFTTGGDVDLYLPVSVSASLSLRAEEVRIDPRFPLSPIAEERTRWGWGWSRSQYIAGRIGTGSRSLEVRATGGTIRLHPLP